MIIEIEDSYPTEESLEEIKKLTFEEAKEFILSLNDEDLPYASIWRKDTEDEIVVYYATGGWSGNEDIISAMLSNPNINMFLYSEWHRGGRHGFKWSKK